MIVTDARQHCLAGLADILKRTAPQIRLRLNHNRRLLVSLRMDRGTPVLSLHEHLLDHPPALADLALWVQRGGRGRYPALRAGMRAVSDGLHQEGGDGPPAPRVALLGGPVDLPGIFARIHASWFAHVPRPGITWSRGPVTRRQQHIRFGCYRRKPSPLVSIHPKLNQPWVAVCFVEHVLFHELCHHAQACLPVRGETMHGRRFRDWERRYPQHALAMAWERAHLRHFLDGTSPVLV